MDGILATVITDELPRMEARLARIAAIHRQDQLVREVVRGIHVEGPFLNAAPGYIGAHPAACVRPADVDAMKRLLDAAGGLVRLVTLAPERDPGMKVIRHLAGSGILVSAGHCDPSLDELHAAIDAGVSMFTHLGNGCPIMLHRHDNVIQRVLSMRDRLTICFIADGVHVPPMTLGNYLRLTGVERTVVVTDAVAAAAWNRPNGLPEQKPPRFRPTGLPGPPTVCTLPARWPPCRKWPLCWPTGWGSRTTTFGGFFATIPAVCWKAAGSTAALGCAECVYSRGRPCYFSYAVCATNCSSTLVGSSAATASFRSSRTP